MSVFSASSLTTSDASARRFKPLPKRRRTSHTGSDGGGTDSLYTSPLYYHPVHGGRVGSLKQVSNFAPRLSSASKPLSFPTRSRAIDDTDGEGDYTDHLQQPNNTKKRKVPAVAAIGASHNASAALGDEDKFDDDMTHHPRVNLFGEVAGGVGVGTALDNPGSSLSSTIILLQKKVSLVTLATLRIKELLETRHKLMAAVIQNDIDPLALNFALSALFPFSFPDQPVRTWSRGLKSRRRSRNSTPSPQQNSCFSGPFTFSFVTPSSTRYTLAKKSAASLQLRFQTELARQAANATEATLKTTSKLASGPTSGQRKKLEPTPVQTSSKASHSDVTRPPTKSSKKKKKKRSALANASNPHHLRNYVPSRVPQSNGYPSSSSTHGQASNASLGPPALKFLSAALPPRKKGRSLGAETIGPSLVQPENEWICPFCEYSLFYGDDAAMQRAVKNRRKILKRRRKARERAAAAASGTPASLSQEVSEDEESGEDDDSFDGVGDIAPTFVPSQTSRTTVHQDNPGPHPGG
ncbi:hypothetical protein FRC12_014491 [Ceratobasidium sp. 428]|nr:hypothetical protein FRC12_014491 [Ceratobasidium sp. 428]